MKKKNFIISFIFVIFSTLVFWSCSGSSGFYEPPLKPEPERGVVDRTVLVYIIANNSLGQWGNDVDDLSEMTVGAQRSNLSANRWIVYHAPYGSTTQRLVEINADGSVTNLKLYEDSVPVSATYHRMCEVLDDMAALAPAKSYGMVLWSHGSSWIVDGITENIPNDPYAAKPLSFGIDSNDKRYKMNISTLRSAVKGRNIDFMYFDACFMNSVEVAYELRDATRYIIGSVSEIPADGMPYDLNMPFLLDGSEDALVKAAQTTFDYYNNLARPYDRTCTMSVIKTSGLTSLALATAKIYDITPLPHPSDTVTNYRADINSMVNAYDFGEYIHALIDAHSVSKDLADEFNQALNSTVIYQDASAKLWDKYVIYSSSGLATHIFTDENGFYKSNYNRLQWAQDVASHHLDFYLNNIETADPDDGEETTQPDDSGEATHPDEGEESTHPDDADEDIN